VKKNLGGRTGYPKKYQNPIFVSPKCGKRLGYARYRIQVWGLEFEVGSKFFAQAINWFSDPSEVPGLLTKIPMENKYMKYSMKSKEKKKKVDQVKDCKSKI
jgi:hypothetical protein